MKTKIIVESFDDHVSRVMDNARKIDAGISLEPSRIISFEDQQLKDKYMEVTLVSIDEICDLLDRLGRNAQGLDDMKDIADAKFTLAVYGDALNEVTNDYLDFAEDGDETTVTSEVESRLYESADEIRFINMRIDEFMSHDALTTDSSHKDVLE